jgi:hypothetical protein
VTEHGNGRGGASGKLWPQLAGVVSIAMSAHQKQTSHNFRRKFYTNNESAFSIRSLQHQSSQARHLHSLFSAFRKARTTVHTNAAYIPRHEVETPPLPSTPRCDAGETTTALAAGTHRKEPMLALGLHFKRISSTSPHTHSIYITYPSSKHFKPENPTDEAPLTTLRK